MNNLITVDESRKSPNYLCTVNAPPNSDEGFAAWTEIKAQADTPVRRAGRWGENNPKAPRIGNHTGEQWPHCPINEAVSFDVYAA